jgi:peptidoglycan/LPS O-acetylase OafA/YrhL
VGLIVMAPLGRFWVASTLPYPAVWNFTTSHLDVFALGVLLASLDHRGDTRWLRMRARLASTPWVAMLVGAVGLALLVASAVDTTWVFAGRASALTYLAIAVVWAWLLLWVTRRPWTEVTRVSRGAVWLGRRSYGIYVYHWPAIVIAATFAPMVGVPLPVVGVLVLVAVLAFSEFSFRWIESPFLKLKAHFSREPAPVP